MPARDAARFLAASPDRLRLLRRLADAPAAPRDLADDLPSSHRSVQRNLAAFADRGWVVKDDGAYGLTTVGTFVTDRHASYLDALDRLERFESLLEHLPVEDTPDPDDLGGADLTEATLADPQAPVQGYVERVESLETARVRMLSPVLSRLFHDAHATLAVRGTHTELVLPADLVEEARSRNPVEFAAVTSVGVLDLFRHPGPVEFGITLADEAVFVCAYDDGGRLAALLESANEDLRAWAGGAFERYRRESEPVGSGVPSPFGGDRG